MTVKTKKKPSFEPKKLFINIILTARFQLGNRSAQAQLGSAQLGKFQLELITKLINTNLLLETGGLRVKI